MITAPVLPATVGQHIVALERLQALHGGFAAAAAELTTAIGVPICVPKCARCCRANTVIAWGIEADYAASWLATQPRPTREGILRRIRAWLVEPDLPVDPEFRGEGAVQHPQRGPLVAIDKATYERLAPELQACVRGRCPLLADDGDCLIHPVRPLVCRAYGVTRLPGYECPRPAGIGEGLDSRAHFAGPGAQLLRTGVRTMLSDLRELPRQALWGVFATSLYRRLRPKEIERLSPQVATVKLMQGYVAGFMLFQSQDDDRRETGWFTAPSALGDVHLEAL